MNPRTLPTASLSLHPEAARVPEMPPEQYPSFAADVKARGVLFPLKLKPGTKTVLDGRTRLRAAADAGIMSVPVEDAVLDDNDPDGLLYMLRCELNRRHLTSDQRAALAADLEESFAAAAKERMSRGGQTAGRGRPKEKGVAPAPQAKPKSAPKSRDLAAAATGARPRAVSDAKLVKKYAPELHEQVKAGTMKLAEATRTVKAEPAKSPLAHVKPSSFAAKEKRPAPSPGGAPLTEVFSPTPLDPCPFCESTNVAVLGGHSVCCHNCGALGPNKSGEIAARRAWNSRGKGKVAS